MLFVDAQNSLKNVFSKISQHTTENLKPHGAVIL